MKMSNKIFSFAIVTRDCNPRVKLYGKDILKKSLTILKKYAFNLAVAVYLFSILRAFLIMARFVRLSEKVCHRIVERGREYSEAYLFVRTLSCLVHHPILLNFRSNLTAVRLLTGYSDKRFRELINTSLTYGLIYFEGANLRLYSRSAERKDHKAKDYTEIKISDAQAFFQVSVLKHNYNQQLKAIKYKCSTMKKGRGASEQQNLNALTINEVTLSYRKIAALLNVSLSWAYKLTQALKAFGLTLTSNRVLISQAQYNYYKATGKHNARYDDKTGDHYYLKANIPSFKPFYKQVTTVKGQGYSSLIGNF